MKIALAQLNYHIGDFENNAASIIAEIERSKEAGADLVVFSELAICGYPPQDLLEHIDFIEKCNTYLTSIATHCTGIAAIVGGPALNPNKSGKPLYNAAFFMFDGKIQKIQYKTLLPTYDIFDESRYFESNKDFNIIIYKGIKIALTICEDLWDEQPVNTPLGRSNLYPVAPLDQLVLQKPDLIINISASPFAYTRINSKKNIFINKAKKHQLPLIYLNQVGAYTELIFEGNSFVLNASGEMVKEMKTFSEDYAIIDTEEIEQYPPIEIKELQATSLIHDAIVLGIRDFFRKLNFKTAVVGLSGGIDSAITTVLAAEAIGSQHVRVLLMPSKYSSDHSISDSVALCKNLNIQYDIVPIKEIVPTYSKALAPLFGNLPENTTEENIQARIRGTLLMALSNKLGNILLNTSNKSEASVGYATLYGDMCGSLAVLGDIYKTELYRIARYINRNGIIIPENIITKAPSAELKPNQKDSDSLPEYALLDDILYRYIELQIPASGIISEGFPAEVVNRIISMINRNEYKRYQAAPILRISPKAFGIGRRMPLVAKY